VLAGVDVPRWWYKRKEKLEKPHYFKKIQKKFPSQIQRHIYLEKKK
jgi:hypothetical protein